MNTYLVEAISTTKISLNSTKLFLLDATEGLPAGTDCIK